jgi:alkylated DNA repair dioxygenase AlkB
VVERPPVLAADPVVQRVDLDPQSWVDVVRDFLPGADQVHDDLMATVRWQQGRVFRYERYIDEPRLGSWQAGAMTHPALAEAQQWISERYGVPFDGAGLALYRDANDSVGFHRDRELKWLDETVIAVLTLGATRSWLMKPVGPGPAQRDNADLSDSIELMPASGDLIVMGGRSQVSWLHAVPKVSGPCASRISVQWRWTSRRGRPDTNPGFYDARTFSR